METLTTTEKEKIAKKIFILSKEIINQQTKEITIKNMPLIKPYMGAIK